MKTPEVQKIFGSYENAIYVMICILAHDIEWLEKRYPNPYLDDIPAYFTAITRKLHTMICTLCDVITESHDYISASALLRCIADNISVVYLVYCQSDKEEQLFRHYVYVLDEMKTNLELFPNSISNKDGIISDEEYRNLVTLSNSAKANRTAAICKINEMLVKHPYILKYSVTANSIIDARDWKYKDISKKSHKNNRYSWNDLYHILETKESFSKYLSFLSQFVHGLSVSNMNYDDVNDETFDPIYSWLSLLINKLQKAIYFIFPQYEELLRTDIVQKEEWRNLLLSFYTKERLNKLYSDLGTRRDEDVNSSSMDNYQSQCK